MKVDTAFFLIHLHISVDFIGGTDRRELDKSQSNKRITVYKHFSRFTYDIFPISLQTTTKLVFSNAFPVSLYDKLEFVEESLRGTAELQIYVKCFDNISVTFIFVQNKNRYFRGFYDLNLLLNCCQSTPNLQT